MTVLKSSGEIGAFLHSNWSSGMNICGCLPELDDVIGKIGALDNGREIAKVLVNGVEVAFGKRADSIENALSMGYQFAYSEGESLYFAFCNPELLPKYFFLSLFINGEVTIFLLDRGLNGHTQLEDFEQSLETVTDGDYLRMLEELKSGGAIWNYSELYSKKNDHSSTR